MVLEAHECSAYRSVVEGGGPHMDPKAFVDIIESEGLDNPRFIDKVLGAMAAQ